jgi:hypothetical protein
MDDNTLYAIRSKGGFIVKNELNGQLEIYEDWLSACHSIQRSSDTIVAVDVVNLEKSNNAVKANKAGV